MSWVSPSHSLRFFLGVARVLFAPSVFWVPRVEEALANSHGDTVAMVNGRGKTFTKGEVQNALFFV